MDHKMKVTASKNEEVPAGKHAEVEVVAVARRRQFSSAYKQRIVREAATCNGAGGVAVRCSAAKVCTART